MQFCWGCCFGFCAGEQEKEIRSLEVVCDLLARRIGGKKE